jgi:hypothetical protein
VGQFGITPNPQESHNMGTPEIKPVIEDVVIDLSDAQWDLMTPEQYFLLEQRIQKSIKQRRKEIRSEKKTGKFQNVSIYGKLYQISQKDYEALKKDPEKVKPAIIAMYRPLTEC